MTRIGRALACVSLLAIACDGGADGRPVMTREQLLDPAECKDCHPNHYREWASSMHAYASEDPVFLAMNRRGQEDTADTDQPLGDFCINCHAPMAVREGATTDGLNMDEVPEHLQGITCYFCHNAVGVESDHNNTVELANDAVMRGSIRDPVDPGVHGVQYSELHDRFSPQSSALCGGCHDIVTPAGVHLERTFAEYEGSLFAQPGFGFSSCQGCHMIEYEGVAADDPDSNVPARDVHEHLWPGVDVALTEFPDRDVQKAAIECSLMLSALLTSIELTGPPAEFTVTLETEAGHNQPSGAAQDRRMWVEVIGYDEGGEVMFESGNIADDEVETAAEDEADSNRRVWMFRDRLFDVDGEEVHMFWEAADYESNTLPARLDTTPAHSVSRTYRLPALPARLTVRTRMRPMGLDVLDDLIDSDHLDAAIRGEMPTFTMHGASGEWTPDGDFQRAELPLDCPDAYTCLLDHRAADCATAD
jgi:hypothetical protein